MPKTASRITTIRELDGLNVTDSKRMPHPVDLSRWSDAGLYRIDADLGVFRLTSKGEQQ
jgi:hypothetical protein